MDRLRKRKRKAPIDKRDEPERPHSERKRALRGMSESEIPNLVAWLVDGRKLDPDWWSYP